MNDNERLRPWPQDLKDQIAQWIEATQRLGLAEYIRYMDNKRRWFWKHFFGGVARGLGMAVGFTILGAVLIMVLQDLARHNLPLIGDLLVQIMDMVENQPR